MTQEIENLIMWAKMTCQETRAKIGYGCEDEDLVPSWLPELENAIDDVEMAQGE